MLAGKFIRGQRNVDIVEAGQGLQYLADINDTCPRTRICTIEKDDCYRTWTMSAGPLCLALTLGFSNDIA
ncbi:MAG: hypothetical protein AB1921_14980 [Thermodesulfobacteriota bacterium]